MAICFDFGGTVWVKVTKVAVEPAEPLVVQVNRCIVQSETAADGRKSSQPNEQSWVVVQNPTSLSFEYFKNATTKGVSVCITTHPEGSPIHFAGCVVSNQPVDESLQALGHALLERAGLKPVDRSATAFLMPDGPHVRYYLINHATKALTWADGDGTPAAVLSMEPGRAQNTLCEEYWVHMENFPAPVPASAEDLRQLKVVLANSSTSDGSTSPFSSAQIQEFLIMLDTFSGQIETFQTYTIARLWCMIWHGRVVNNFGTTGACLDRFSVLSEQPPVFSGQYASWSRLFIGAGSGAHLARCSRAWAGRIAYVTEWRNFKSKNELEWTQAMYLASVLVIASLLVRSQSTLRLIPTIALAFGCASAANSYHLISESQNLGEHAADASMHFQRWETAKHGVQGLALRNAAPRALLVWGFIIFLLSAFQGVA
ncbi:hypothetical protein FRC06_011587 [Ceratobasidium sp. 370]|nr:hypothetical protein FRC06_011587 [Ceratobasidium sp. 370]